MTEDAVKRSNQENEKMLADARAYNQGNAE